MFPLGTVVFPHQTIPLHVFEPRYRMMVHDVLAGDRTFGIVLIERGSEVGGGDVRFDVGTLATVVDAEESPDGRWALRALGGDRVTVHEWLPDDPYPVADVAPLPAETWNDDADAALRGAIGALRSVIDEVEASGGSVDPRVLELPGDPLWDHWLLADRAPLGDLDRLALLRAPSPAARLQLLTEQLADLAAVLASRRGGG
jgi:Lon protease-like protein